MRWPLVLVLAGLLGCSRGEARKDIDAGNNPPRGEVWLTDAQIGNAKMIVAPLEEQEVDDVVLTSGKVSFDDARVSHVFSPVSGRIVRITAQVGQRVKKGDVLAVLESPDIGIASADLRKAEADRIAAEHDLDRQKELLAAHATSQRDFEQAEDAFRKSKAEVERAKQKAALFRAGGAEGVTQTYAIRAEIDGEVVSRNVTPGAEVQGQYGGGTAVELFTVGELDKVWVLADLYEMDVPRVKPGSKVTIRLVAFPGKTFPAQVDWVSGTLDPSTRTAKVRCVLANAERMLKPEMYATLAISVDQHRALALPRTAILRVGDGTAVFVEKETAKDGRHVFVRVPVTIDEAEGGKWVPVQRGLDKGARVVVEGAILLQGGDAR